MKRTPIDLMTGFREAEIKPVGDRPHYGPAVGMEHWRRDNGNAPESDRNEESSVNAFREVHTKKSVSIIGIFGF
jgi:hypothetical protein